MDIPVRLVQGGLALPFDGLGVWRPSARRFYLDRDGNGRWKGTASGDTRSATFGQATDSPVTGDWNGDGRDEIGVWRPGSHRFILDANANDTRDAGDIIVSFGSSMDIPVTGLW